MGFSLKKVGKSLAGSVKDAGKSVSKGFSSAIKTGATATFEYGTLKPLEAVAPKVLNFADRAKKLVGQASQLQRTAQSTVAENQGLFGVIPGMDALSPYLGGGGGGGGFAEAPVSAAQPQRVPVWVWIIGGVAALLALVLILRKKA